MFSAHAYGQAENMFKIVTAFYFSNCFQTLHDLLRFRLACGHLLTVAMKLVRQRNKCRAGARGEDGEDQGSTARPI